MLTFSDKNGISYHFAGKNGIVLHISSKIGQVEPETAALGPLKVPVEPRAAAVHSVYIGQYDSPVSKNFWCFFWNLDSVPL